MGIQLTKLFSMIDGQDRKRLTLLALMLLVNAVLEVAGVGLILPFIQLTNDPSKIHDLPLLADLYQALGFQQPKQFLMVVGISFFALVAGKNAWYMALAKYQTHMLARKSAQTAQRLFDGYLRSPWVQITQRNSSDLITVVETVAPWAFQTVLLAYITLLCEGLVMLGIVAVMVAVEPLITLAASAILGTAFMAVYLLVRRRIAALGKAQQEITADRLKALQQGLGTAKEIRVLGRENYFIERFRQASDRGAAVTTETTVLQALPRLLVETLVMGGVVLVVMVVLAQDRPTAEITSVLGLFAVGAFRMIPSMNRMLAALHNIRYGAAAVDMVHADISTEPKRLECGHGHMAPLSQALTVDNGGFAYPDGTLVLDGVSLTIPRGRAIGFVGASGAGKTTLIDLILGILTPGTGTVTVDGLNIHDDLRGWQRQIGYVPQTITLIDDSIRRNVAFGLEDDEIDADAVRSALAMAQLTDFVEGLPDGLETAVGERGVRLSGGQRQRIGIARALYHGPQVLVMDEATSALDGETEREITLALEGLHGSKTLLIIAHRLSTVKHCDTVVVMKNGTILDAGNFNELVGRCAEFQRMVEVAEVMAKQTAEMGTL